MNVLCVSGEIGPGCDEALQLTITCRMAPEISFLQVASTVRQEMHTHGKEIIG